MDRRRFVGAAAASLLAVGAVAQQTHRVWRVGVLETVSTDLNAANLEALREGLRGLGYIEGRNLIVEYRSADGRGDRFPDLADDLVRLNVDVIVTRGTPATLAAKNASRTIPIVMARSGDPVGSGLVTNLARPGGNVTGLSTLTVESEAKRLELIREIVPGVARIAALSNMGTPNSPPQWKEIEMAAQALGVQSLLLDVRKREELAPAFESATKARIDAIVVGQDALLQANRRLVAELAAVHHLPAIYRSREFTESGGLISYGPNYPEFYRHAAIYVDKILRGARPGDLSIEQPTKFELVINLKTAKALGITIPQPLLLRVDEVIQ